MLVIKKINTSALLVEDEDGRELIVLGKGISFKVADENYIDDSLVEKKFFLETPQLSKHFLQLVERIPLEYIEFSQEMINFASEALNSQLNSSILISLPDHIAFSIERSNNNPTNERLVLPEIQIYYPEEYKVAKEIVNRTRERFKVDLDDSEVLYITFHLINAMLNQTDNHKTMEMTTMISRIMHLIESEVNYIFDKDSYDYSRLILHIKFFVQRVLFKKEISDDETDIFDRRFLESNEYTTTENIINRIEKEFNISISKAEINYLAIHILKNRRSMEDK